MQKHELLDEIQVFEGVAERTGKTVDRTTVRKSPAYCRTISDLTRKARRMGDGYFYLASLLWPENTTTLNLSTTWVTFR